MAVIFLIQENYKLKINTTASVTRIGVLLFLGLVAIYIFTASGRIDTEDGYAFFDVSQSLFEEFDVSLPPPDPNRIAFDAQGRPLGKSEDLGIEDGYRTKGRDGRFYSPTGLGFSLLLVPFLALGKMMTFIIPTNSPQWTMEFVAALLLNPLISAGTGLLVFLTGCRLAFSPMKSLGLAVIYALGTMTWVYAKSFFSDPLVALMVMLTVYGLISYRFTRRQKWLWIGGASLGFAILTKPTGVINIPLVLTYLFLVEKNHPRRVLAVTLLAFVLPLAIGLGGMMVYNWWRFESFFDTGYRDIVWITPLFTGLYGLILSPGKGYLLYNPISLGALIGSFVLWRKNKAELGLIGGIVVINLLFFAKYEQWHGGGCWGPRYLLQITPLLILPLGSLLENIPPKGFLNFLLATLITLSVIVQIPGISVNFGRYLQEVYLLSVDQYYQRVTFQVAYSPLVGQWGTMNEVFSNLRDPEKRLTISQLAFSKQNNVSQAMELLSVNVPDFWFVYLGFMRGHFNDGGKADL